MGTDIIEREQLRGPVKEVRAEERVEDRTSIRTFQYDRRGRLLEEVHRTRDGCETRRSYRYDSNGVQFESGTQKQIVNHSDGSRTETVVRAAPDKESRPEPPRSAWKGFLLMAATKTVTDYDPRGCIRRIVYYDSDEVAGRVECDIDEHGHTVEERHYSGEKPTLPLSRWQRFFLRAADKQKYAEFLSPGGLVTRTVYRYDDNGRVIEEERSHSAGVFSERADLSYNGKGDLASKTRVDISSGELSTYEYEYEYDDQNNWTRKVVIGAGGDSLIEIRRTISYYNA